MCCAPKMNSPSERLYQVPLTCSLFPVLMKKKKKKKLVLLVLVQRFACILYPHWHYSLYWICFSVLLRLVFSLFFLCFVLFYHINTHPATVEKRNKTLQTRVSLAAAARLLVVDVKRALCTSCKTRSGDWWLAIILLRRVFCCSSLGCHEKKRVHRFISLFTFLRQEATNFLESQLSLEKDTFTIKMTTKRQTRDLYPL